MEFCTVPVKQFTIIYQKNWGYFGINAAKVQTITIDPWYHRTDEQRAGCPLRSSGNEC